MLSRFWSQLTWCPKSIIATACCTASQINYWIIFGEFRTMLLGWSHKFSHITPALATLYWLLINRRIDFKIALLVYKALNGETSAYIVDLLQSYDPPWKLCSADKQLPSQPPCRLRSYGDHAFCSAATVVWNRIPPSVKTAKTVDNFKVKLKTNFYSASFAYWYVTAFQSWYTLTVHVPWAALDWICLRIRNSHYYYHYNVRPHTSNSVNDLIGCSKWYGGHPTIC